MTDTDQQPRPRGQRDPGGVGRAAEEAVIKYLKQIGTFETDVRDVQLYREYDIDFVCKGGRTVEVKGDTWTARTGNLFFEVLRDHGGPGCFYRSKAEWWYYVAMGTGDCYAFRLSDAQSWLKATTRMGDVPGVAVWQDTRSHRRSASSPSGFVQYSGYKVNLEAFRAGVKTEHLKLGIG